jgi:predicted dehydrogenase
MMQEIRWGIIGCGNVTEVKSGPAFAKISGSRLVMVMRRDAAKAADYAARHAVPRWTTDADALINDSEVDAVYIATPPDSHADYTRRVAAAGKPVYVEKPMARTSAECEAMLDACAAAGVPLFVAYYRRRLPTFVKVAELLAAGALGDVRCVRIELFQTLKPGDFAPEKPWRVRPEISGGGYFHDLASHQFDILDHLLGPIDAATGYATNHAGMYSADDAVTAGYRFANGVLGNGLWCFTVDAGQRRDVIEIVGSRGALRFACFDLAAPVELTQGDRVTEYSYPPPQHVQQPLIETIIAALQGRGECPSTGASALRTNRVLEQITGR